ncbi:MAG: hypothetical protein FD152_1044 [Xanthobacteraceae bacterium]|nr:MAG: hypothetical protein FD152_1044 [Xanthobacteraceae bacterium]
MTKPCASPALLVSTLDKDIVSRLAGKKASDLALWDSASRAAKGALGPANGTRGMVDALCVHHAAHLGRTRTLEATREMAEKNGLDGRGTRPSWSRSRRCCRHRRRR